MNTLRNSRGVGRDQGFSAIEIMLVLALSGILVVGLTSIIEVPQQMAAREQADNPSISSAEIALATLEQDLRFATAVRVPTLIRCEADQADGSTVVWDFNGLPGRPVTRTVGGAGVAVLRNVDSVRFNLVNEEVIVRQEESKPVTNTGVEAAKFDTFSVKSGFSLGGVIRVLTAVTEVLSLKDIDGSKAVGFYFRPKSLDDDEGIPTAVRVRLQRNGTADLLVRIYESTTSGGGGTPRPDRAKLVATGQLLSRRIPAAMAEVAIPVTMTKKLKASGSYFVELRSATNAPAAKIEAKTLSILDAAADNESFFLTSGDGGSTFNPFVSKTDASQARFTLDVVKVDVDDSGAGDADGLPAGFETIVVPVAVAVRFTLNTPTGLDSVKASFPITNNLAIVKR